MSSSIISQLAAKRRAELKQARVQDTSERLEDFIVRVSPKLQKPLHLGRALDVLNDAAQGKPVRLLWSVPPRHAKPLRGDTIVSMADGSYKRLDEIVVGDRVISGAGRPTTVLEIHDRGVSETVTIKLRSGREIVCTPDHEFKIWRGYDSYKNQDRIHRKIVGSIWQCASELKPYCRETGYRPRGDYMQLRSGYEIEATNPLTLEEARFLGYIIGDGCCTQGTPSFTNACPKTVERFTQAVTAIGSRVRQQKNPIQYSVSGPNEDDTWYAPQGSNPTTNLLRRVEMYGKNAHTKRVPLEVFKCENSVVVEFIAAYFECDGTRAARFGKKAGANSSFSSVSRLLLEDVQRLMTRLGIATHLYKKMGRYKGEPHTSWCLAVTDDVKFYETIPVLGYKSGKSDRVAKPVYEEGWIPDQVVSVVPATAVRCLCITVADDESFLANGVVTHNSFSIMHLAALILARDPTKRIAYVTYGEALSLDHSRKIRELCEAAGVELSKDVSAAAHWKTTKGGSLTAVGVGGALTGKGFDLILVDDPHKSRPEVESELTRTRVHDYFSSAIYNRAEPGCAIIVIHTRWSPDDLIGHLYKADQENPNLLTRTGWDYINTPAISDDGKALWPERFPIEELRKFEAANAYDFASLYQGSPRPRGGAIFQNAFYYDALPEGRPKATAIGIDLAYTAKSYADFSVSITGELHTDGKVYITGFRRKQCEPAVFAEELRAERNKYPSATIFWFIGGVEKGIVDLLRNLGLYVRAEIAKNDKFVRAQASATTWNTGKILLPRDAPWLNVFLGEVLSFTGVGDVHDDIVDALGAMHHPLLGKSSTVGLRQKRVVPF